MPLTHPNLDQLMSKVDSKYTLVVVAARRARQIMAEANPLADAGVTKPVTLALNELLQDKLRFATGEDEASPPAGKGTPSGQG